MKKKTIKELYADEVYRTLEENFHKQENKELWLVQNGNQTAKDFSERLYWIAGVTLGLLPLVFAYIPPINTAEVWFLAIIIFILLLSFIFGLIDFFMATRFWRKTVEKARGTVKIWYSAMLNVHKDYPEHADVYYKLAMQQAEEVGLNKELSTAPWPINAQAITAIFAITLQVIYLLVKLFSIGSLV